TKHRALPHESVPSPTTPGLDARRPPRLWLGLALLLASAAIFSLHNTVARLSYDEGVAPTTIAATRTWAIVLLFVVLLGARGQWPSVPRVAWLAFAATAVCYAIHNPLLLVAFQYIPVSLAVLVMYVFPIVVAFLSAAIGQERLRPRTLGAAAIAFTGITLVLNVGAEAPDWRGVALAAITAIALAGNLVGAAQLNRHMSALGIPFALSCLGAVVFGAMMLADGGPTLPTTPRGWWLFAAATVTSPAALIAFYLALPRAGAPRSALAMNIEPVITVLVAMLLLGETLGAFQAVGAALIVGAIAASAVMDLKSRRMRVPGTKNLLFIF
ncbi:MAG: DMT family transporter, partial [Alphaproteobacteria bacterium]